MENRPGVATGYTGGRVCLEKGSMNEFRCGDGSGLYPDCGGVFTIYPCDTISYNYTPKKNEYLQKLAKSKYSLKLSS